MDEQYIAIYDTLMLTDEMTKICASAKKVGTGLLIDYSLTFLPPKELPPLPPYDIALPTLKHGRPIAPVAVYTMSRADELMLYRYYKCNGYHRTSCRLLPYFIDTINTIEASTYILSYYTDDDISVLPHDGLKSLMMAAYVENDFTGMWMDKRFY